MVQRAGRITAAGGFGLGVGKVRQPVRTQARGEFDLQRRLRWFSRVWFSRIAVRSRAAATTRGDNAGRGERDGDGRSSPEPGQKSPVAPVNPATAVTHV